MSKDRKKGEKGENEPPTGPLQDGGSEPDLIYTEHIKVPLEFKQRLEKIAQEINQRRKRRGRRKRATGWFVVRHLQDWMEQAEAEIEQEE